MDNSLFQLQTPCFIFDEHEFSRGTTGFREALQKQFKSHAIGYSVKTNSLPYALTEARKNGCYAEVVSHDEYQLALLCGYAPAEIIYNGPMKSKETFIDAVVNGAVVNIETKRELDWLKELPVDRHCRVGIRLNINISHVSPDDADGDDDNSRFGFSDESDEFREAVEYIRSLPNVELSGLHIHRTAHSRSIRFYENSVGYAASVINKYNLKLDYLDVGGGYFGIFPNKPTFADYAKAIADALEKKGVNGLKIIVEPGNALTASAFKFLSEVIDSKRVDEKTLFLTTDGSRNDVDPFFHKTDYLKEILYSDSDRPTEPTQVIAGCTCLEYDRLFTLHGQPRLRPGDRILYNNVGAYTMCLSPLFIRLFPCVYAKKQDGRYTVVRKKWTAADIVGEHIL